MKKSIIFLAFFGITIAFSQKITTLAEYKSSIKANKAEARKAISPFLYDGYKTTYFNYKTHKQTKEIEVYLFNNTEYKLAINAQACFKGLTINFYNKPKGSKGRILLKTIDCSVTKNYITNTNELNKKLKELNKNSTRLKRVFISYEIPAVSTANNTNPLIEDRAAAVLVMGYKK